MCSDVRSCNREAGIRRRNQKDGERLPLSMEVGDSGWVEDQVPKESELEYIRSHWCSRQPTKLTGTREPHKLKKEGSRPQNLSQEGAESRLEKWAVNTSRHKQQLENVSFEYCTKTLLYFRTFSLKVRTKSQLVWITWSQRKWPHLVGLEVQGASRFWEQKVV